jgi:hypothetical protein
MGCKEVQLPLRVILALSCLFDRSPAPSHPTCTQPLRIYHIAMVRPRSGLIGVCLVALLLSQSLIQISAFSATQATSEAHSSTDSSVKENEGSSCTCVRQFNFHRIAKIHNDDEADSLVDLDTKVTRIIDSFLHFHIGPTDHWSNPRLLLQRGNSGVDKREDFTHFGSIS